MDYYNCIVCFSYEIFTNDKHNLLVKPQIKYKTEQISFSKIVAYIIVLQVLC